MNKEAVTKNTLKTSPNDSKTGSAKYKTSTPNGKSK
jgi:hypothetical protein